jgi:hypothetical protein
MQIFTQKHDDIYEQEIRDWEGEYDEEPTREDLHPDKWMAHQCGPLWLAVVWYGGWTYYGSWEDFTNRFYTPDDRQLGPTYATKLTSSWHIVDKWGPRFGHLMRQLGRELGFTVPWNPAKNLCEQLASVARNDTPNFRTFKTTFTKFFVAYKAAPRRANVDDLVLSGQVLLDFSAWLRVEIKYTADRLPVGRKPNRLENSNDVVSEASASAVAGNVHLPSSPPPIEVARRNLFNRPNRRQSPPEHDSPAGDHVALTPTRAASELDDTSLPRLNLSDDDEELAIDNSIHPSGLSGIMNSSPTPATTSNRRTASRRIGVTRPATANRRTAAHRQADASLANNSPMPGDAGSAVANTATRRQLVTPTSLQNTAAMLKDVPANQGVIAITQTGSNEPSRLQSIRSGPHAHPYADMAKSHEAIRQQVATAKAAHRTAIDTLNTLLAEVIVYDAQLNKQCTGADTPILLAAIARIDTDLVRKNEAFDLARDFFDNMAARLGAEKVAPAQQLLTMTNFGPDWDTDLIWRKAMLQGKLDRIEEARAQIVQKEQEAAGATHEWEREMEAWKQVANQMAAVAHADETERGLPLIVG